MVLQQHKCKIFRSTSPHDSPTRQILSIQSLSRLPQPFNLYQSSSSSSSNIRALTPTFSIVLLQNPIGQISTTAYLTFPVGCSNILRHILGENSITIPEVNSIHRMNPSSATAMSRPIINSPPPMKKTTFNLPQSPFQFAPEWIYSS